MPTNLDEVRRAFESDHSAGTVNGNVTGGDPTRRGDASNGDGTSVASVKVADVHAIDSDRTVSPVIAVNRADDGKRARTGAGRVASNDPAKPRARVGTSDPETASNIEALLFSVHCLLVENTKLDALALTPAKAKSVAQAIDRVNSFYGNKKGGVISPKTYAWINLLIAAGGTYVPMLRAVRVQVKERQTASGNESLPTGS